MLKIGDFSKLSRISIRMLRHYDELGLLTPETIDPFTGYRYYSEAQLFTAGRINALKAMGFRLCDAAEVLRCWEDREALEGCLLAQRELSRLRAEEAAKRLRLTPRPRDSESNRSHRAGTESSRRKHAIRRACGCAARNRC